MSDAPPAGFVPYKPYGLPPELRDQKMLFWRKEWGAPHVMRISDAGSAFNVADLYVRDCDALREHRRKQALNRAISQSQNHPRFISAHSQPFSGLGSPIGRLGPFV